MPRVALALPQNQAQHTVLGNALLLSARLHNALARGSHAFHFAVLVHHHGNTSMHHVDRKAKKRAVEAFPVSL